MFDQFSCARHILSAQGYLYMVCASNGESWKPRWAGRIHNLVCPCVFPWMYSRLFYQFSTGADCLPRFGEKVLVSRGLDGRGSVQALGTGY